jgi:hypothetical protein
MESAPRSWGRPTFVACLALSVMLAVGGRLVMLMWSKEVGEPSRMSYDTAGSRVGIVLVAVGLVLLVGTLVGLASWVGPLGMTSLAVLTAAASALMVRPPHVYAASNAYPKPHEVHCRPTAVHQAFNNGTWDFLPPSDATRECHTKSRIIVGSAVGGAALGFSLIAFVIRRRATDGSDATDPNPNASEPVST